MVATIGANVDGGAGYSPLSNCMSVALMIFGDNNVNMADGSLVHLLLYFANQIVTEVNTHPYRTDAEPIEFYTHPSEVRSIPDQIMIAGIAAYYAGQQNSQKAPNLLGQYYKTLNSVLWTVLNGNTQIEARIFDKGPQTSTTNGLVKED